MESICSNCGKQHEIISKELGVCLNCIRNHFSKVKKIVDDVHKRCRREHNLPEIPPKDKDGIPCSICVNQCKIGKGKKGFCSVRKNEDGKLVDFGGATLNIKHDKLPSDCIADAVCAGCTGSGYPEYAYDNGPEFGHNCLSVFYGACSFDCLFCQNWYFRDHLAQPNIISAEELASNVEDKTSCVVFYGGDPTPQIYHAIKAARLMLHEKKNKILRICFETDGAMNENLAKEITEISLLSGGTIKIDLKAFDNNLHYTLTGVSNSWTLKNLKIISKMGKSRKAPKLLVVSTLMVPGYIDPQEISHIAKFIAKCDPDIPYTLVGFYPQFYMYDLPPTSKKLAEECLRAAKKAGLRNVSIGNKHLLI